MKKEAEKKTETDTKNEEYFHFKTILNWLLTHIKFLLIPGYHIEELSLREIEFEKNLSKRRFINRFKHSMTIIGILIIFLIITMAIFPEWIAPYSIEEVYISFSNRWDPPSPDHPLGLNFGRDVLSLIIFGANSIINIAIPSVLISVFFGVILGLIAAYYGGWIDSIIMRIGDIFLSFPGLMLAMILIQIWEGGIYDIILSYGIIGIPVYARLIRGSVLKAKSLPYIDAARVSGANDWRIMFRHILPNCIQPIIIAFTFDIGAINLSLAALAFLGFGGSPWGSDISLAKYHLLDAPWATFWPSFMIIITVVGFMLLGDGLREAFDPKLKNL
jgi:peptide/nickel transport system permease protein